MRLIRVVVDAFQCIRHAEVDLAPGLNVLYGPNDLGKSSLAAAIRNVLLLPHTSASAEDLASWHSGDLPRVALTFGSEAHRIHRVTKSFGSGGSSLLEFSNDGSSFSTDATARQVDAKLRELLKWGIVPPGGKGAVRGLPDSFLCNVLLADQLGVPDVLARGLGDDGDESARRRLNEALQALAQDPLFKRILDTAVQQVEVAFTPTGQPRRGRNSPFTRIGDEIRELEAQKQALQSRLNATISAEKILQDLHGELDGLATQCEEADRHLAAVRDAHAQLAARAVVEEELRQARAAGDAIRSELAELAEAELAMGSLQERVQLAGSVVVEKSAAVTAAGRARDEAELHLQQVAGEQGAQARQLALQELENDRLRATARRNDLQRNVAAAEVARQRRQEETAARVELENVNARLAAANQALAACDAADRAARDAVGRQALLETVARLRDAEARLGEAENSLDQARRQREAAATRRDEAERLQARIDALRAPAGDEVRKLAELSRQLEVAEARLSVGLSVALRPLADVRLRVAVDGAAAAEHAGAESLTLDAQRSVTVRVDDLLDIAITAGEATARAEAERLRDRWAAEALPVLAAASVSSLADLEELRRQADDLLQQVIAHRDEVESLERQAAEQDRRTPEIDGLRKRVGDLASALAGRDRAELEAELGDLGAAWETEIERRRSAADGAARTAAGELNAARERVAALSTEQAGREAAHRQAAAAATDAMAQFPDGLDVVLENQRGELAHLDASLAEIAARIEALSHQAEDELTEARRSRQAAGEVLETAEQAARLAQAELEQLREALARAAGSLDERRRQAQRLDLPAAEAKVEEITRRLDALPTPGMPAGDAEVTGAEQGVQRLRAALEDVRSRIDRASGAIDQVGGNVVREDLRDIERALQLAVDRRGRLEIEFRAWQLLQETLREAENSDGAHLGRALTGPLTEQFGALTAGRYGPIAIGQDLELPAECVEAAGDLRSYRLLSAGTQDQLGTIFRLCIAEQLGSFIVLDDHLSQSDPDKIRWFRARLLDAAARIQIVLLTCRPEDYLRGDEVPQGDEAVRDSGALRAINLGQVIQRYASGDASTSAVVALDR